MKNLYQSCTPRQAILDGTADFVVNLADLPRLNEDEAREFLDSNVLTSGMEMLLSQAFARMAGTGSASGIYKLSESMGGGKTQSMIVAGILALFPHLASLVSFKKPLSKTHPDVVAAFTGRATDKKVWVSLGDALGVKFPADRRWSIPVINSTSLRKQWALELSEKFNLPSIVLDTKTYKDQQKLGAPNRSETSRSSFSPCTLPRWLTHKWRAA